MLSCFEGFPNRYDLFEKDIMRKCVVERKTEIMGEAINRIKKVDPTVEIPNARAIIDTRIIRKTNRATLPERKVRKLKRNVISKQNEAYLRCAFFRSGLGGGFLKFFDPASPGSVGQHPALHCPTLYVYLNGLRISFEGRSFRSVALGRCATAFSLTRPRSTLCTQPRSAL